MALVMSDVRRQSAWSLCRERGHLTRWGRSNHPTAQCRLAVHCAREQQAGLGCVNVFKKCAAESLCPRVRGQGWANHTRFANASRRARVVSQLEIIFRNTIVQERTMDPSASDWAGSKARPGSERRRPVAGRLSVPSTRQRARSLRPSSSVYYGRMYVLPRVDAGRYGDRLGGCVRNRRLSDWLRDKGAYGCARVVRSPTEPKALFTLGGEKNERPGQRKRCVSCAGRGAGGSCSVRPGRRQAEFGSASPEGVWRASRRRREAEKGERGERAGVPGAPRPMTMLGPRAALPGGRPWLLLTSSRHALRACRVRQHDCLLPA